MKLRYFLPAAFILVCVLAACAPPLNLRNDKFLSDDSLISDNPVCAAPCWRGITPGETKWTDALTILEDAADIDDPQVQKAQEGPALGAQWQSTGGESCCQMISEDGETVELLVIWQKPDKTLKQVIDARGEPAYAIATPGDDTQAIVSLFYPDESLIVIAFIAGTKGSLSETSEVIGAYYLTPDRMDLILKTSSLYAWNGYEAYSAYDPDKTDGDFAITPSVTLTPTATGQ